MIWDLRKRCTDLLRGMGLEFRLSDRRYVLAEWLRDAVQSDKELRAERIRAAKTERVLFKWKYRDWWAEVFKKSSGGSDPGDLKAASSRIPCLGGARERGAAPASSRAGSVLGAGFSTAPAAADTVGKGSRKRRYLPSTDPIDVKHVEPPAKRHRGEATDASRRMSTPPLNNSQKRTATTDSILREATEEETVRKRRNLNEPEHAHEIDMEITTGATSMTFSARLSSSGPSSTALRDDVPSVPVLTRLRCKTSMEQIRKANAAARSRLDDLLPTPKRVRIWKKSPPLA